MRKEFIECKSRATAYRRAPWAATVVKLDGGFMAFESAEDACIFKGQK